MFSRLSRFGKIHILWAGLLISGCASVQRAILEANLANSVPSENSDAQSGNAEPASNGPNTGAAAADQSNAPQTTGSVTVPPRAETANTGAAVDRGNAPQTTAMAPPQRICDRSKALAVGMTIAQVYASCWGKPKSVNTSTVGATKTEILLYEGYNYIYAENGIVKSIETSGR